MIRVKTDYLSPGSLPVYDFPSWSHDIFFLDVDGKTIMKFVGPGKSVKRVSVPEFELNAEAPSSEEANKKAQMEALRCMANFCLSVDKTDGMVIMPIRNEMVMARPSQTAKGARDGYIGILNLGLALSHDDNPDEEFDNYFPWVPKRIWDIREFARDIENQMFVDGVMAE